jgi:hypothetical protein
MGDKNRRIRWLAVLSILALLISACGGDSDTTSDPVNSSEESNIDDSGSEESNSGDSSDGSSTEVDSSDELRPDDSGVGNSGAVSGGGELDCEAISAAVNAAGDLVGNDPTLTNVEDREQDFANARAMLLELKAQAPEIADDVDQTIEGLDVIGEAFGEIGWDTDFTSDPAAAVTFAQKAFSNPAVAGLMTSTANIGLWLASNCTS